MRHRLLALAVLISACGSSDSEPASTSPTAPEPASSGGDATGPSVGERLQLGLAHVQAGDCRRAIDEGFDPAIAALRAEHPSDSRVLGARAPGAATLAALAGAAAAHQDAVVMGPDYSDALYLRAFCEIELGDLPRAEATLNEALAVIPNDVVYACELGHLLQQRGEHRRAIQVFTAAFENAEMLGRTGFFDPTPQYPAGVPVFNGSTVDDWRRRALRGVGFSQYELRDFAAAEQTYRRVLAIDPSDEQAQRELRLILQQHQTSI